MCKRAHYFRDQIQGLSLLLSYTSSPKMDFTASRCPGKADPVNQKAKKVLLTKRRREEVSKFWGKRACVGYCQYFSGFPWSLFFFFAFIFLLLLIFFVHLFVSVLSVCLRFVHMF